MSDVHAEAFMTALRTLASDRDLPLESVAVALVESLAAELRSQFHTDDSYVSIDLDSGELTMQVPDGSDVKEVTLADLGRRVVHATQAAVESANRSAVADQLRQRAAENAGRLAAGTVTHRGAAMLVIAMDDGTSALLPDSSAGEKFRRSPGQRLWVRLTAKVDVSSSEPRVLAERTSDEFFTLVAHELHPAVARNRVQIVRIARAPGVRTKMLVASPDGSVDPVAVTIGRSGSAIAALAAEMAPERIDVTAEAPLLSMAAPALAPAEVLDVTEKVHPSGPKLQVTVTAASRGAAFGPRGVNVRLASKLLGCPITLATPKAPAGE